jgi:hypothetical protein
MVKGRKAKTALPECELLLIYHKIMLIVGPVIELSDDGTKVRCTTCERLRGNIGGWILKESLTYHLKSEAHARAISAQQNMELIQAAGEQSIKEEREMEQTIDFATLSSAVKHSPAVAATRLHVPSAEEQEMWYNHALNNEWFDAGTDHSTAASDERKRLEREATDFDLWHGAVPEQNYSDGGLLLEELEQEDIMAELLRNTSMYCSILRNPHLNVYFVLDLDVPDAHDILEEEARCHAGMHQSKPANVWAPYDSKMVSRYFLIFWGC